MDDIIYAICDKLTSRGEIFNVRFVSKAHNRAVCANEWMHIKINIYKPENIAQIMQVFNFRNIKCNNNINIISYIRNCKKLDITHFLKCGIEIRIKMNGIGNINFDNPNIRDYTQTNVNKIYITGDVYQNNTNLADFLYTGEFKDIKIYLKQYKDNDTNILKLKSIYYVDLQHWRPNIDIINEVIENTKCNNIVLDEYFDKLPQKLSSVKKIDITGTSIVNFTGFKCEKLIINMGQLDFLDECVNLRSLLLCHEKNIVLPRLDNLRKLMLYKCVGDFDITHIPNIKYLTMLKCKNINSDLIANLRAKGVIIKIRK
jgi:hypothetical protein